MGQTVTEKIIARKVNLPKVDAGQIMEVPVDLAYIHDNNAPIMLKQFELLPKQKVWDPKRVHFVLDHHSPSTTIRAAQHHQVIREFARKHGTNLWEVGRGISHSIMAEEGYALPGSVAVGTDSHTVGIGAFGCLATGIGSTEMAAVLATGHIWLQVPETVKVTLHGAMPSGVAAKDIALHLLRHFGPSYLNYAAVEIDGPFLSSLPMDERIAITIMGLEMGVKNILMPVDDVVANRLGAKFANGHIFTPDADACYSAVLHFDVSDMTPIVATPGMPTNGVPVSQVEGVKINQATLGSCSGAFYHDLEQAAKILNGRRVHPDVRFIIVPNSQRVIEKAVQTGIFKALIEAGAIISSPACGTCAGYEVGCLAPGEVCISTTTRNMDGRMGPGGLIYLGSAMTVAASALTGYIADPRRVLGGVISE
jgi:3-isopropylmalate dehydratase large subunit